MSNTCINIFDDDLFKHLWRTSSSKTFHISRYEQSSVRFFSDSFRFIPFEKPKFDNKTLLIFPTLFGIDCDIFVRFNLFPVELEASPTPEKSILGKLGYLGRVKPPVAPEGVPMTPNEGLPMIAVEFDSELGPEATGKVEPEIIVFLFIKDGILKVERSKDGS